MVNNKERKGTESLVGGEVMWDIPEQLRDLTIASIALRFFLAGAFGGIIGMERGRRQQAAGLRTHMMVCIGAAATMMVGEYVSMLYGLRGDSLRIGAQVVSGIGFLGAGTIIVTKQNRIRGLTTAASLWASACMGLAVGSGVYEVAVIMMIAMLFVLLLLSDFDIKYVKSSAHVSLFVEVEPGFEFSNILTLLKKQGWSVQEVRELEFLSAQYLAVRIDLMSNEQVKNPYLELEELRQFTQIHYIDRL